MKISILFIVYAILAAVTCLFMLFAPAFWFFMHGAAADPLAILLLRSSGALFGGLAVMAWAAHNAEPCAVRDAMALGLAVASGLSAGVAVLLATSSLFGDVIWISVAVFTIFAIAFFLARRPTDSNSVALIGNAVAR